MSNTTTEDEFSFLKDQARELGALVPPVHRVTVPLTDDRSLSVLRWGTEAPRVTFLHGAGLNAHTWDATILSLGLPALAIDLAGHGDSSWRADANYSPATLAADVLVAIEALTEHPQVLAGQSLGGLTAAVAASARPDLVAATVLVDVTPSVSESAGAAALREFFRTIDFPDREAVVDHAVAFGLGGERANVVRGVTLNSRVREDGRVEWKHHIAQLFSAAARGETADFPSEALFPDYAAVWESLEAAPNLSLVHGTRGFLSAEQVAEFSSKRADARVTQLESGHNIQEELPAQLAELVRNVADEVG